MPGSLAKPSPVQWNMRNRILSHIPNCSKIWACIKCVWYWPDDISDYMWIMQSPNLFWLLHNSWMIVACCSSCHTIASQNYAARDRRIIGQDPEVGFQTRMWRATDVWWVGDIWWVGIDYVENTVLIISCTKAGLDPCLMGRLASNVHFGELKTDVWHIYK